MTDTKGSGKLKSTKVLEKRKRRERMVNKDLLNKAIKDSGLRKDFIASELRISKQALSNKINGKNEFRGEECTTLRNLLHLDLNNFVEIFFASKCACEAQRKSV